MLLYIKTDRFITDDMDTELNIEVPRSNRLLYEEYEIRSEAYGADTEDADATDDATDDDDMPLELDAIFTRVNPSRSQRSFPPSHLYQWR